ncbi:MAG: cytochrome C [Betaproteobacteria bacterium]
MKNSAIAVAGTMLLLVAALAAGQARKTDESSGELIYTTYCIGCHTTQVHWREKRLATDWMSLKFQVRRWLMEAGTGMGEDDVTAVAGYLNGLYYKFPVTDTKQLSEAVPGR